MFGLFGVVLILSLSCVREPFKKSHCIFDHGHGLYKTRRFSSIGKNEPPHAKIHPCADHPPYIAITSEPIMDLKVAVAC